MANLPAPRKRDLPTLASELRREVEQAERDWQSAVGHAIRAGELLIEAKAQVKHGEWMPWLKANFPGSVRSAQGYMRLATAEDAQGLAHLGVEGALKQLAAPKRDQEPGGDRLGRARDYISEANDCYRQAFEEFEKAGIVFGPTSLTLPDDLSFEDWKQLGAFLASINPDETAFKGRVD